MFEINKEVIIDTWGECLIRHRAASVTLHGIDISIPNKKILEEIGLPLIMGDYPFCFLPFTFLLKTKISESFFYIIGDMSIDFRGLSFASLKQKSENVYKVSKSPGGELVEKFMNENLLYFLLFITKYNVFVKTFADKKIIDTQEIRDEYAKLIDELVDIDPAAMQADHYWRGVVDYMKIDFADSFDDYEYPKIDFPKDYDDSWLNDIELPF